jgi:hypothetical protein
LKHISFSRTRWSIAAVVSVFRLALQGILPRLDTYVCRCLFVDFHYGTQAAISVDHAVALALQVALPSLTGT